MAVQIQFRRDTGSNWSTANTVLAEGELGINTTTNQFKIGNGSTAWNSLAYAPLSGTLADLDDITNVVITSAANGDLLKWNGSAWVNASGYALLASPTFTGTPTLPTGTIAVTQTAADSSTKVATTAFVTGAVTDLIGGAPGALNTLNELAEAINDDASYAAGITSALGLKAPLASPTFTGTPTLPTGTIATTQTASNNSTAVATTAYVDTADALKANIASPTFTGTPTLPTGTIATTQTANNNSTALATTAYVDAADALKANLASPTFTGTPTLPTGTVAVTKSPGNNSTAVATTAYVDNAASSAASALSVDGLSDTTITSAASGQFLKYNGSAWVNDAIDLATDTVGNYMVEVSAGTGISVSHTASEGSTATISAITDSDQFVLSAAFFS